jgi:mono/diheme cytochrome c family protein
MMIRRVMKWIGIALLGIAGIAAAGVLAIYVAMGSDLSRTHDHPGDEIPEFTDAASIEEGQRLAQLRGCSGGCHGRSTEGQIMFEFFDGSRVVAPDLGKIAQRYTTTDFERAIRHGIRPDGTSVIRLMPSEMFASLSDRDLGLMIAYLRSRPPGTDAWPESRYGPLARIMGFMFKREFGSVMAAEVIEHVHSSPPDPANAREVGRYLADTTCTECHGDDLRGAPDGSTPGLAVAMAYSREQFATLMRTGQPLGDRELDFMGPVARSRFVRFTDEELSALHDYLSDPVTWSE